MSVKPAFLPADFRPACATPDEVAAYAGSPAAWSNAAYATGPTRASSLALTSA
jgi:hypothetical protein